jgi:hypothetical protein
VSDALTTFRAILGPDAAVLARDSTVHAATPYDPLRFEMAFAAAGRRLGTMPLGHGAAITDDHGHAWSIAGWGRDEAARAFLLVSAAAHVPVEHQVAWLEGAYRAGALRERTALLRTLPLLPGPARFLAIALDACRTSTQPVFEAIACENPYPAAYFPDASFAQLAMKAVFTGVALARILGLVSRRTPELARMAHDYAAERRAAGRDVPADLTLLETP